ncbi:uncharacterized protein LOC124273230 [Haliotis rubra]|uniref:uncharacterized protein LOC124273230 n=1 Tax=Haliotis rubra TaxID=36100 RepID=UPI001EE5710B|nr:uncharacterized protein LOC124273230 [Haliotis rubra]
MADLPRKRVSTSYKRYIKEHTGKEGVPPSSKRAFMESYNKVISHLPSSSDVVDNTKSQQTGTESVLFEDEGESSQYQSADDDMNRPSYHATSEGEGGIGGATPLQHDSTSGQQSHVLDEIASKIQDFQEMKYSSDDDDMQEIIILEDDFHSTCSSDEFGFVDDELSEEDCQNSEDEDFNIESDFNSYIYKGSQITLSVSILLILAFATAAFSYIGWDN